MKQDMILILDLGIEENPRLAREIRAMGVYTEIHPHDISAAELAALPNAKGIILNGGVNRVVDGVEIDASAAVYGSGLPIWAIDHKGSPPWQPMARPGKRPSATSYSAPARQRPTGTWTTLSPTRSS